MQSPNDLHETKLEMVDRTHRTERTDALGSFYLRTKVVRIKQYSKSYCVSSNRTYLLLLKHLYSKEFQAQVR